MSCCRLCGAEVKPHQIYCPNCGAKLPLLSREELKEFKKFKKKFKTIFIIVFIIVFILFLLFMIKVPVTKTVPYRIEERLPELKLVEESAGCREEDFLYSLSYEKPQVFADMLKLTYNIKNLEGDKGIFKCTTKIVYKLSLKEEQKTSELLLGPYENKTISTFFEDVKSPGEVDYYYEIKPPKKKICETKTRQELIIEKKETVKTRQEVEHKSLFELILEKID